MYPLFKRGKKNFFFSGKPEKKNPKNNARFVPKKIIEDFCHLFKCRKYFWQKGLSLVKLFEKCLLNWFGIWGEDLLWLILDWTWREESTKLCDVYRWANCKELKLKDFHVKVKWLFRFLLKRKHTQLNLVFFTKSLGQDIFFRYNRVN